ncbi:MAG: hypothetical protein Kow00120_27780 [Anaerolineae bacterium]
MTPPSLEVIFSLAALGISVMLFRFLATGGPPFIIIGDMDPERVDQFFEALMWACGAVIVFQVFRIVSLILLL